MLPLVILTTLTFLATANATDLPWKVNQPIVTVKKSRYTPLPLGGNPAWVNMAYVGSNLELLQTVSVPRGDEQNDTRWRRSIDNGQTWSEFKPVVPSSSTVDYGGVKYTEYHGSRFFDCQAGVLLETWLRMNNNGYHTYYRLSWDQGETWNTPKMLRYDKGEEFDPNDTVSLGYIQTNQGYFGNNIIRLSSGKIVTVLGNANANRGPRNRSLCFIATWDATAKDYQWTPGNRVAISRDKSPSLSEPEIAELRDGRVLVVWRGEKTDSTPGRKWFSVSTNGGMTLSAVAELKYDDGSSFYSPASFHRMVRSSLNGKLYWLGNITANPPGGRGGAYPRYPLVIAEVDETGPVPSLRKSTVTAIDDRQPIEPEGIEFSNFTLVQNRQTHALDLYMVVTGHSPTKNYKYVVILIR
ncbi:MAG: sialidase family protein [Pirellulales bacterium]